MPYVALGRLLHRAADWSGARAAFEEALRIAGKHGGRTLQYYPRAAVPYAALLLDMGEGARAAFLLEDALAVLEERGDLDRPEYGTALLLLARLHEAEDDRAGATALARRALGSRRAALGQQHPEATAPLVLLAQLALEEGRIDQAATLALEAADVLRAHIRRTAGALPEVQALKFAARSRLDLDVLLYATARSPATAGELRTRAFDAVIRNRCLVLDEMALRQQRLHTSASPETAALLAEVQVQRSRHAALILQEAALSAPQADLAARIADARAAAEAAERRLADASAAFRLQEEVAGAGLAAIREHLPPRTALISYVRSSWPEPAYSAFVLPGPTATPVLIPLGPAGRIDGLIEAWRSSITARPSPIPSRAADAEQAYREHGEVLRRAVWDLLVPRLAGSRLVLVVPDSRLNLVSLATLPGAEGSYLLESGPIIHYLSAERDLVERDSAARPHPRPRLLAIGDPDYGEPPDVAFPSLAGAAGPEAHSFVMDAASPAAAPRPPDSPRDTGSGAAPCSGGKLPRFQPLPLSGEEINAVDALFRAGVPGGSAPPQVSVLLTGTAASEATFKRLAPGFSILHLATHAFFLPSGCPDSRSAAVQGFPVDQIQPGPLLRSGLAFAGANHLQFAGASAPSGAAAYFGPEDGILTAAELAATDLTRAEWVVLSACESGMGDLQESEGLMGLRRALRVAGAASVITSLWEVPDAAARDWMTALYRQRLAGASTAGAVHQAALSTLAARRAAGRSTHPYFWGAFIGAGDPD